MDNPGEVVGGPVKAIVVEVAEFFWRDGQYVEGPRVLAQTVTYDAQADTTEDLKYYADGSVLFKLVTTRDAGGQKSTGHRYHTDGSLIDKWLIYYHPDGSKSEAYRYSADGRLLQRHAYTSEEPVRESGFEEHSPRVEELCEREFDSRGNWVKEVRFTRSTEAGRSSVEPTTVIYRTITYL